MAPRTIRPHASRGYKSQDIYLAEAGFLLIHVKTPPDLGRRHPRGASLRFRRRRFRTLAFVRVFVTLWRPDLAERVLETLEQSPTDPAFVAEPYPFYARARAAGDLIFWQDYGMAAATSMAAVMAILKDRRLGREAPPEYAPETPAHMAPFYAVEAQSMLEAEPPRHTRNRSSLS